MFATAWCIRRIIANAREQTRLRLIPAVERRASRAALLASPVSRRFERQPSYDYPEHTETYCDAC